MQHLLVTTNKVRDLKIMVYRKTANVHAKNVFFTDLIAYYRVSLFDRVRYLPSR